MKALILIDYTNDFVADDGKLTTGAAGQAIDAAVAQAVSDACTRGDMIVSVNDLHHAGEAGHPETKLFPPHNIEGTSGRELYGMTGEAFAMARQVRPEKAVWLDKLRYSAFAGTPLDILLRQNGIHEIELAGVCTDICVLHTAVDAYDLNYDVTVRPELTASFSPEGHRFALAHFRNSLGFNVPEPEEADGD